MCLYSTLILNPKYKANKKNGGVIPPLNDPRVKYVPIGCQNCIECRKQKARSWQIRMLEDLKTNKNGKFITLTFSNESIANLCTEIKNNEATGYELDNEIATLAMRRFLERWRKTYKKSLRHWTVTELGHNGTENIHLHGIVWTNETYAEIESHWKYGHIWPTKDFQTKTYVNEATVNYITKYVTKRDEIHTTYKPIILTSPGIGKHYTNTYDSKTNKFNYRETIETYTTRTGHEINLPIYWRNKIYNDEQREKLWTYKLDKNERWICGEKIKADDDKEYWGLIKFYRKRNIELGYGTNEKDWNREQYERQRRIIIQQTRIQNAKMKIPTIGEEVINGHQAKLYICK